MSKPVSLYVIGREDGPVKIGISSDVGSRLTTIQTSCPFKVSLFHEETVASRQDALRHEREIHEVYAERRLHGEWFDMDAGRGVEAVETCIQIYEHFQSRK